ncbi:MAG: hypothetical protein K0S48_3324, partial [Ramlibacter sp.]|nr:hypothetical protein [Ramlibacter sp.]
MMRITAFVALLVAAGAALAQDPPPNVFDRQRGGT